MPVTELEKLLNRVRTRKQENIALRTALELRGVGEKYGLDKDAFKHEVSFAAHTQELLAATLKYAALPYKFSIPGIINYSLHGNIMLRALEMLSGDVKEKKSPLTKTQRNELKKWKTILHKFTYMKEAPEVDEMLKILKAAGLYEKQRKHANRK